MCPTSPRRPATVTTTEPSAVDHTAEHIDAPHALLGGALMGLANLVPGISGGTMILAVGLYDRFIGAVAEVTRFRFRRDTVVFLGTMAVGLVAAVLVLSGVAVRLVAEHRGAMYALFIGMTLGGAPDLWKEARPMRLSVAVSIAAGLGVMTAFALGSGEAALEPTPITLLLVGAAAASSMILPGISGSYVLLILGLYDTVVGAISFSELRESPSESLSIVGPVIVGAGLGVALLSNVLRSLLRKHSAVTHGALLGLLLGSVIGLYPFQEPVHPELANRSTRKAIEAVVLDGESSVDVAEGVPGLTPVELDRYAEEWRGRSKGDLKRESLRTRRFTPDLLRFGGAIALFLLGIGITRLVGRHSS